MTGIEHDEVNAIYPESSSGTRRDMEGVSRRSFLAGAGIAAAAYATRPLFGMAGASQSPFKVSVISDEISQDFDHACSVIANDFGLQWLELREMWGKNPRLLLMPR